MAGVENIPVYKSVFRLVNLLLDEMENVPVKHRRTLGDRTLDAAYESLALVHFAYRAQSHQERSQYLGRFLTQFTVLNTYLRIVNERRLISLNKTTTIFEQMAEIIRQIKGWKQSADNKIVCEGSGG